MGHVVVRVGHGAIHTAHRRHGLSWGRGTAAAAAVESKVTAWRYQWGYRGFDTRLLVAVFKRAEDVADRERRGRRMFGAQRHINSPPPTRPPPIIYLDPATSPLGPLAARAQDQLMYVQ